MTHLCFYDGLTFALYSRDYLYWGNTSLFVGSLAGRI